MTNKTLAIVIIILIIAGGAAAYALRDRTFSGSEPAGQDTYQTQDQPSSENSGALSSQTPMNTQTNFDEEKLKTASVDIENKHVLINVKDFGTIEVELYDKDAPKTVENFLRLANSGYYDGLTFHRVSKGFVIQGGDPNGNGSGGQSAFGAAFADELDPATPSYKAGYQKGVLAMANSGPNTNGSQFFILLGDATDWMPHNYTIFGKVVAGQDVVDRIGNVEITPNLMMDPSGNDGTPKTPVVMEKLTIVSK